MDTKQRFEGKILESGEFPQDGKVYPFVVVRRGAGPPNLSGFVALFPDGILVISEEVSSEYREHYFRHEVICCDRLKGQRGRCIAALKEELATVPPEIRKEYIIYRRTFFSRLVEYLNSSSQDEDLKSEVATSVGYITTAH